MGVDRNTRTSPTRLGRLREAPNSEPAWNPFVERLSADAAAQQLGIRVTAVFKAKSRILQMLRGEIARLEPSAAGETES